MTPEKQAEDEIQRLNSQLESRVIERTAQLEAANQELEAFSYSVSHDLRAPLRHILGYVDILQTEASQTLNETSRQHLQTIAQSATQMGQLIDALLEFSRMSRAEMRCQRVSLAALVEDVRRELRSEIKGREIDWQIGDLPEVQGDPLMLRQAIVNLLSNAIKYTRTRSKAKIEIGAKNGGRETIFFVRDNGVGFDMNHAGKLFGVFQRFHRSSEFEGTGIGLAKVRRIIHRHGGRTWAEGKADGGATFNFSIPKPPEKAT
jgi:light-regulated signal transduction histidine kinase (bacteriophytochrome)